MVDWSWRGVVVMADGIQGAGKMPFDISSNIHQQTRSREAIETHLADQRVEKEHRANHRRLEALREQSLELSKSYDKFGGATKATKPQGANVNIEV